MKRFGHIRIVLAVAISLLALSLLPGCGGTAGSGNAGAGAGATTSAGTTAGAGAGASSTGAAWAPTEAPQTVFDQKAATFQNNAAIDTSHAAEGYVTAKAQLTTPAKAQVSKDKTSYLYNLPGDGMVVALPLNMDDGSYNIRIMQRVNGNNYAEVLSVNVDAKLKSEFEPFLRSTYYCQFANDSACAQTAREITANAETAGDAVAAIYSYVTTHISYDTEKAERLTKVSGYVPNPDETLATGKGICFDYASLMAAMLRSVGIPCQIVTGFVSPDDIYHAWNMVYVDGKWTAANIDVKPNTWSRLDPTFGASSKGLSSLIGGGQDYVDRYIY